MIYRYGNLEIEYLDANNKWAPVNVTTGGVDIDVDIHTNISSMSFTHLAASREERIPINTIIKFYRPEISRPVFLENCHAQDPKVEEYWSAEQSTLVHFSWHSSNVPVYPEERSSEEEFVQRYPSCVSVIFPVNNMYVDKEYYVYNKNGKVAIAEIVINSNLLGWSVAEGVKLASSDREKIIKLAFCEALGV